MWTTCAPRAELAGSPRTVDSTSSCTLPLSCHGGSPSLPRVLNDNSAGGQQIVVYRDFGVKVFLHCYRLANREVFGMLEVTTMVSFLTIRLGVLYSSLVLKVEYSQPSTKCYKGPRHIKRESGRTIHFS